MIAALGSCEESARPCLCAKDGRWALKAAAGDEDEDEDEKEEEEKEDEKEEEDEELEEDDRE